MNQVRNIVIIGPAYPLRGGGMASFNERLAREFTRQGYHTTIYTFSYQYPGFLFPGTSQYSSEPEPRDLDIHVEINSINPLNWIRVGNQLKEKKPDLIVVRFWLPFMGPCLGTILRRVKKNEHTRVICIADNIIPHEKRPGDTLFTRYFLKPIDGFITMSENVLAQLRQFVSDKPATNVPHPLYDNFGESIPQDEARAHLKIAAGDRVMLFFGFIRRYKGLDILLAAMKLLVKKPENRNLKLLIAGEFYEGAKNYESLLTDPEISGHIIAHTHFIADRDIKYYLCAADVTVQPYRNATQSGVTPLSYHFEVPMIVTRVGGLPAMVPDGKAGLIAEPNPESLAQKIEQYFSRGKESFLPGLRDEKKKYSWQKMVDEIVHL